MSITGRPASTKTDHEKWEDQRRAREAEEEDARLRGERPQSKFHGDRHMPDGRLTSILKVVMTVIGGLLTLAIWTGVGQMISLDKNVALLLARPVPVSKEQYDRDMEILRTEQRNMALAQANMKAQLETIQNRQQAAISRNP